MDLLPGLPNDIALECLIRLPLDQFSKAASVCSHWKNEIKHPAFRQRRKSSGFTRPVFALAQAMVTTIRKPHGVTTLSSTQFYRLSLYDPEKGNWYDLPPIPELVEGIPMFCRVVGVGSDLIVIGGCDPVNWRVMDSVFIYNFISGSWRRGADMPGEQRLFFGCGSDSERFVLIAGGHNDGKNALKSVLLYDVAKDEWVTLPEMAMERDECNCVFHRGKFHVIGGYPTHAQGQFQRSAEVFDLATRQWCLEEDFLGADTCPQTCLEGDDGRLYMCQDGDVVVKCDATWRHVAELPAEISNVSYLTAWQGKLLTVGNAGFDELHRGYELHLSNTSSKEKTWTKVDIPDEYCGHIQSQSSSSSILGALRRRQRQEIGRGFL
ncbi:PREDICTED: F-box/kelch-repeat protein At1g80440-like [Nicotiana attenuata]|uniref:F-box/kelch-repeat protein At1g80440-like n=1 Tax=Nicotiana attenuata TaxID=49451 RepID=UPI0009056112|nr:PREDICTED: F-box/kelch-repeat protein At1g80440-like [Nicotiana attenuata]